MSKKYRRNKNARYVSASFKIAMIVNTIGVLTIIFVMMAEKNPQLLDSIMNELVNLLALNNIMAI